MAGLTLDTGALIAVERNDRKTALLLKVARINGVALTIPAGALGRAWRDGRRQARLARLVASAGVEVEPLDAMRAREAGQLCGVRGTSDVIDASVALGARRRGDRVLTADVDDIRRLDPSLAIVAV